ncbi:MAG: hypothetical protein K2G07_05530, partial [Muribaculaceae bacterium]|nr:hypothetical protein [Muribaculaceae bacterium]
MTEKVKAGYADMAHDLDEDSPVREEFLSRKHDDTALGHITMARGMRSIEKAQFDTGLEVGEYAAGASGGFFGKDADGDSFAEVARLYVRVRAFFEELTVIKAGVLAGKQYITPGGGVKTVRVEETSTAWRCWFL